MDAHAVPTGVPEAFRTWQVTPVTEAEFEAFTRMQYTAFMGTDNVLHDVLFPPASDPTPADIAKTAARHYAALTAAPNNVAFIKVVDERSGKIAGGAKWCFYDRDAERPPRVQVDWVRADDREFAQRCMDEFHGRRVSRMKGPHALLDICFCNPAYERRGVASALVDFGCRRADEMKVSAFTEASPRGQPVYARKGFVATEYVRLVYEDEVGRGRQPADWYHMERKPGATEGRKL